MYINSYIFSDIKNIIIFRRESEFTFTCNVIRVACCTKPFWSRGRFAANNNKFHHKHHIDPFLATINSHKASSLVIAPLFCAAQSSLIIQYQLPTLPRSTKISFFSSYPALTPLVSSPPTPKQCQAPSMPVWCPRSSRTPPPHSPARLLLAM